MKVVAVLNEHAGNGSARSLLPLLRVQLHAALADVRTPRCAAEATAHVRAAVRDGADVILAAGGDGTVNAVINGMDTGNASLALLPSGSANDFAVQNGLTRNVQDLCRAILRRNTRRVDLIDFNGWRYATDGGLGLCADVARTANRMRARNSVIAGRGRLGSSLYPLAAIMTLAQTASHALRLRIEANTWSGEVASPLLMVNNQRMLGGHFPVSPAARNDDGLFDVCMVADRDGRYGLLRLMGAVLRGQHAGQPDIHSWQATEMRIESDKPAVFLADGELSDPTDRFDIRVLPSALRLVVASSKHSTQLHRRWS